MPRGQGKQHKDGVVYPAKSFFGKVTVRGMGQRCDPAGLRPQEPHSSRRMTEQSLPHKNKERASMTGYTLFLCIRSLFGPSRAASPAPPGKEGLSHDGGKASGRCGAAYRLPCFTKSSGTSASVAPP